MNKIILILAILFAATPALCEEFEVGQIWKYKTRDTEPQSILTIVKIDHLNGQEIIHISLEKLKIKNPDIASGFGDTVSHLPIGRKSLEASVTELVATIDNLPSYKEGYNMWREAFDSGKGGFFTMPVSECVDYIEKSINQ